MTNRRDMLKLAGSAMLATAFPFAAKATEGDDAAIFALMPAIERAYAAYERALDIFHEAESRAFDAKAKLPKPVEPPYCRASTADRWVLYENGKRLGGGPTSPDSEWDAYNAAKKERERVFARIDRKFKVKRLDTAVSRAWGPLGDLCDRILALRARTPEGMAAKLRLSNIANEPAYVLESLKKDIEALTDKPVAVLS